MPHDFLAFDRQHGYRGRNGGMFQPLRAVSLKNRLASTHKTWLADILTRLVNGAHAHIPPQTERFRCWLPWYSPLNRQGVVQTRQEEASALRSLDARR